MDRDTTIQRLLCHAGENYAKSLDDIWLAAVPSEYRISRCDLNDPDMGIPKDGNVPLPWGELGFVGTINVGAQNWMNLVLISLLYQYETTRAEFLKFAGDAGALLAASPPRWAKTGPSSTAQLLWCVNLFFCAPMSRDSVVSLPGALVIQQPWQMSLAALREWTKSPSREPSKAPKRSGGSESLIAALSHHHRYACDCDLNQEPIGNNDLARKANVSKSVASEFLAAKFGSHKAYKALCADSHSLLRFLKVLNGDFSPKHLMSPDHLPQ